MNYKERREYLVDNFLKLSMMTPENERNKLILYVDGIGYVYSHGKLIIKDITKDALSDGKLIIDSVFDSFDMVFPDKLKTKLLHLELGNITKLHDSAFKDCLRLEKVVGNKVKTVPVACFSGCKSLVNVHMSQLVYIRERAFESCNLENFKSGKLTKIDNYAFLASGIKELICGKNVEIQCYALGGTYRLTRFTAESLNWVDSCFYNCPKLSYLDIGYFKDNDFYYDESDQLNRFILRLKRLNISSEDMESHINDDTKMFNKVFDRKRKKNEVDKYPYKFNEFYSEFHFLKDLSEFHYKLNDDMDIELQRYYESRMKFISIKNNAIVVRDN